ncbi:hypothetical protein TRFO_16548 [Tritrichomonas foetus]|uniref:Uncharacterized protein n=1 Tax=Tritrichomonas foetus TaxID=1144522 RepID=A0A1J4KPX5_9EUKA|nr:hypothetical protein TRFO_16548 [Tritrichomonas foetus]|eukprot:OHT13343.1 hypothetical protein TRFO_16548 [Tritrichomonas foetus]
MSDTALSGKIDSLKKLIEEQFESATDQLNDQLFSSSYENDQLRTKLTNSSKKVESLEKEISKLKKAKSDLDLEDEINEMKLEKDGLLLEIDHLKAENEELKQKFQSVHSSEIQGEVLIEWRDKFFKLQKENTSLLNQIEEIKKENENLKSEHEIMTKKMETVDDLTEKLTLKTKETDDLNKKVKELNHQIREDQKIINENEQNKQKIQKLKEKIASQETQIQDYSNKLENFEEIKKLNEILQLENNEVARFKLQCLEMEKMLANHEDTILENVKVKDENKKLLQQSLGFQERLKASLEQSDMLIKTLTDYRSKMETITDLECDNMKLTSTVEKLQQELEEKDQVFESLQLKIKEKLKGLVDENQQLKQTLNEQNEIHELNQKKIKILSEINSESGGKLIIEKDTELELLKKELNSIKKENQTLETICRVSAEQIFEFQNTIEVIKSNVNLLTNENTNIRNECLKMNEELQIKETEIEELQTKIKYLEEINNEDDFIEDDEVETLKKEKIELQSKINLVEMADIISMKSRIQTLTDQLAAAQLENKALIRDMTKKYGQKNPNIVKIVYSNTNEEEEQKELENVLEETVINEMEVDADESFVDVEVTTPLFQIEKKDLADIRSEFVRYLEEAGQIDDVMKVIKNEDDKYIRMILNEIKRPDKNEIKYLQEQNNELEQKNVQIIAELQELHQTTLEQSKELESLKHDSNMYQKHLDNLAHLLK